MIFYGVLFFLMYLIFDLQFWLHERIKDAVVGAQLIWFITIVTNYYFEIDKQDVS